MVTLFRVSCLFLAVSAAAAPALSAEGIAKGKGAAPAILKKTGFLDYIETRFEAETGHALEWKAVDAARAVRLGMSCDAEILMLDIPGEETKFMDEGYGRARRLVMYTDFVLVGPALDTAGVSGVNAIAAFSEIASKGAPFASREDDSSAHQKELFLWSLAGVENPTGKKWYIRGGKDRCDALVAAAQRGAYTIADRGEYLLYTEEHGPGSDLRILVEGGRDLRNQYSVIGVETEKCRRLDVQSAEYGNEKRSGDRSRDAFIQWVLSSSGQKYIADFTFRGTRLFTPNAGEEICGSCR
jgi:tungstate transport system substrate-binding protein